MMKNRKARCLVLLILGVLLAASAAQAKIEFIRPVVGPKIDQTNLEEGAEIKITIRFTNDELGKNINISGAKVFLEYNSDYLDPLPNNDSKIADTYAAALNYKMLDSFCSEPGKVYFYRDKGSGAGIPVNNGQAIDLLTITFHVKQDKLSTPVDPAWFVKWDLYPDSNVVIVYDSGGQENAAQNEITPYAVSIKPTGLPHFGGINSVLDQQTGNRLNLDWSTSANGSDDLNSAAQTYYVSGNPTNRALRYNVYRKTDTAGAGAKLLGPLTETAQSDTTVADVKHRYYYTVRAEDDCRKNADGSGHGVNEDANIINQTNEDQYLISHDVTPPELASTKFIDKGSNDKQVNIKWPEKTDADFDKYIVLRKTFTAIQTPDPMGPNLGGASLNANPETPEQNINGPDYSGKSPGDIIADGWEFRKIQTGNELTETGLINGNVYYYAIYAFDPVGGDPYQQGRNYSTKPVVDYAIPGKAPDDVYNIRALSDPANGEITLKWTNPILDSSGSIDPIKAGGFGGALVVYTTSDHYDKWFKNEIAANSAVNEPTVFKEVDIPIPEFPTPTSSIEASYTLSGLLTTETYYFKAFAYNIVPGNNRDLRLYAPGVKVAAVPQKGGGAEFQKAVPIYLSKIKGKTGINQIRIPFPPDMPIYDENNSPITNLQELINSIQTKNVTVTTLGWWNKSLQQMIGYKFGTTTEKTPPSLTNPQDTPIFTADNYQVSINTPDGESNTITIVIKNFTGGQMTPGE